MKMSTPKDCWAGGRRTSEGSRNLAQAAKLLASMMGDAFKQRYRMHNGEWWLFSKEEPMRVLAKEEISWHTARNHFPFVEGGIDTDHPDWWKEP